MRLVEMERATTETNIKVKINLDEQRNISVSTGIPFFDHMLFSFAKHSGIGLELKVIGDIEVDYHHTIEDTGIVIGEAIKIALSNKQGIVRFGEATIPLDEALSRVVIDISGRPCLHWKVSFKRADDGNNINPYLFEEFFKALVNNSLITLHIDKIRGKNSHHIIESIFKSFARAFKMAIKIDGDSIPSTKGML